MADDASVQQSQINNSSIPLGNYIGDIGGTEPLIIINGFQFARNAISHCEISTFSWLPECSLVLHCFDNVFLTQNFPKDGDLVNIFIRSFTDNFNPIRNDYLIIQVSSNSTVDGEGRYGITIYIHGVLFIPKLFAEDCYSLSQMTSFQAMAEIAKNLKLGYVSNETATVDTMTWINAFDTNENFIRKIVSHSYKDQDSFYDYWIDFFYNLNFMNVNKMLAISDLEPPKQGLFRSRWQGDINPTESISHYVDQIVLTNEKEAMHSQYYFNSFEIINKAGEISTFNGYKRHVHFYNKIEKKEYDFDIESLTTEGAKDTKIILKGRANENFYQDQKKYKWLGWQYNDNVHEHYKMAEIQNYQNLIELKKINLLLHLPNHNFNLYKGQRIPLYFMKSDYPAGEAQGRLMDSFLSGNYVIQGINFVFDGQKYEQEILISRREWGVPNINWAGLIPNK